MKHKILLNNGQIYTPSGIIHHGWIVIENGRIIHIDSGNPPECSIVIDAHNKIMLPGFIDLHTHGAHGHHTMQATSQALKGMAQFYAQHGVTSFLAATITDSTANMIKALEVIAKCKGPIKNGATLLGAYVEGPYINSAAKGAHNENYIRRSNPKEYMQWFEMDVVRQITIAPEFPENIQLITACVKQNIMPCIGHTQATFEQTVNAISLGSRQATHLFNAMSGLHHRTPGAVGALLSDDSVSCEVIADFVHIHPAVLKIAVQTKGIDKIVLVTDSESGAGLPACDYSVNETSLSVTDKAVFMADGTLAGSILTMNKALKNIIFATGLSLESAWPMSSYNAARQLGLHHKKGKLAVGYDADIVILNSKDFSVAMTLCQGNIVYNNGL